MGISLFGKRCMLQTPVLDGKNWVDFFTIQREKCVNGYLVLQVKYYLAENLEGEKIMIYHGFKNSVDLLKATELKLDPHFSTGVSPVLRLSPILGFDYAVKLAERL